MSANHVRPRGPTSSSRAKIMFVARENKKDAEPKFRVPFEADHKGASALATVTSDICRWRVAPAVYKKQTEAVAFGCQNRRRLLQIRMAAAPVTRWTLFRKTSNLEL